MFPPFPPDYPYGHPLNPYDTGNAVNPLSVFAVSNPIIQAIRAGAGQLAPKTPQQTAKPPAPSGGAPPPAGAPPTPPPLGPWQGPPQAPPTVGGWPGITPQPVPSPIGTTLNQPATNPIESVTSTFGPYDPSAGAGYWSSDPVTGNPVWVDPNAGAPIDLGATAPTVDLSGVGVTIDLGGGGSYGPDTSGWASSMVDSGMTP